MRKTVMQALCACLLLALSSQCLLGQAPKAAPMSLKVGDPAPDFKLQYFDGTDLKNVSLSDYHGKKNVILAFYIFAFTGG
jgi:AhpC/TSA family protein